MGPRPPPLGTSVLTPTPTLEVFSSWEKGPPQVCSEEKFYTSFPSKTECCKRSGKINRKSSFLRLHMTMKRDAERQGGLGWGTKGNTTRGKQGDEEGGHKKGGAGWDVSLCQRVKGTNHDLQSPMLFGQVGWIKEKYLLIRYFRNVCSFSQLIAFPGNVPCGQNWQGQNTQRPICDHQDTAHRAAPWLLPGKGSGPALPGTD